MIPQKVKDTLKKQHYAIVGKHSAVQVCRWTKKSLRNEGVCYKEKFYGIKGASVLSDDSVCYVVSEPMFALLEGD